MEPESPHLDLDAFRREGHRLVDVLADHLASVRERPVFRPMSADDRRRLLDAALPEDGAPLDRVMDDLVRFVLPHAMGNGHPRFFGWVNPAPAPAGVLADLVAAAMNPSVAGGDHAAVYVERAATRWLMDLIGFPREGAFGILTSGGSAATLIGLAAARHRGARDAGFDVRGAGLQSVGRTLTFYTSSEGHSSIVKAAELLGVGRDAVRRVPTDPEHRLDVPALEDAIRSDRDRGLHPACVAASAGTVNTGAVDPLAAIADICAEHGLWMHVDGSYGAVARALPELAGLTEGLDRADSIALDPHKWLSVPVECGCALVRDGGLLRDAFSLVPPYLRTEEGRGFGGLPWFSEYGFQQTRGFRALKLHATLRHLGAAGVRAVLRRNCAAARDLAALVEDAPDLELLAPVSLSIVCFRHVPRSMRDDAAALDRHNDAIAIAIQERGRAFLTSTRLRGLTALRACVLHHDTTTADVRALVDEVLEVGRGAPPA